MFLKKNYDSNRVLLFCLGSLLEVLHKSSSKGMVYNRYTVNVRMNKWQEGEVYRVTTG